MSNKLNQLTSLLKGNFRFFISISLAVFLFILFFQPFSLVNFDFDNKLLFVAGFGTIVYINMVLVRVLYPWITNDKQQNELKADFPSYLADAIIVVLNSVAFAFYLRYVGSVSLSFYIIFKVFLICLTAAVASRLSDTINALNNQNDSLIVEKRKLQSQVDTCEEGSLNKSIEFNSENNAERLKLLIGDVVLIRSADNYVEIVYVEGAEFKKQLIRNTLKNIELQMRPYINLIRCHRTCIVNTSYIQTLVKRYNSHFIVISGYPEQIPVSRQYLLKLKENI